MRDRRRFPVLLPVGLLVLFLVLPDAWTAGFKGAVREAIAPMQAGVADLRDAWWNALQSIRGFGDLKAERDRLVTEMSRDRRELQELRQAARENDELRSLLGLRKAAKVELVAAEVIARDAHGWWQTLRIDKGLAQGVRPGMAVISLNGLVGRAQEVTEHTAEVLLISDPACKVAVRSTGSPTFGILQGRGTVWGGQIVCRMDFINKDQPIGKGDMIVTSGLGGVFPRGLFVGYVDRVYRDESDLYQRADIVSQAGIGHLTTVFVVTSPAGRADAARSPRT